VRWRRRGYEPPTLKPIDPWMDETIVINDKPTTLRVIRRFAVDMSEVDYRNDAERGLAMTIVALVDEVSWLQAQLRDAQQEQS
jgi:hypothetical protein